MWDAFKADIADFASTVKTDTSTIIDGGAGAEQANQWAEFIAPVPASDQESMAEWQKTFDLKSQTECVTSLLEMHPDLHKLHEEAVPQELGYDVFWSRFFYRRHKTASDRPAKSAADEFTGPVALGSVACPMECRVRHA
eukprot:gene3096-602_t